jgi:beta-phosphoglucomutase
MEIEVRKNGLNEVECVILDMDGVIIDSHPAHRKAWQQFLNGLGKDVSETDLNFILDGRKRREILAHFFPDVSEFELTEYGKKKDDLFQRLSLDVSAVPGVLDFIEDVRQRGIPLAVATSASRTRTRSTLNRLQLSDHFAAVVTGDDVPEGKPDPAIYKLVCARLGVQAQKSVVVEDAVSAVQAVKKAGFKCVAVGSPHSDQALRTAGADHVIEDFVGVRLDDWDFLFRSRDPQLV